jgi:hypothetical protein
MNTLTQRAPSAQGTAKKNESLNRGLVGFTQVQQSGESAILGMHARCRLLLFFVVLCALCVFASTPVLAQEASATVIVGDEPITVGDVIELVIEVRHPAGTVAIVPTLDQDWGDLEVLSQGPVAVEEEGDSLLSRQMVEAVLFAPGDFETPGIAIALTDGGGTTREIIAPAAALTVQSVLTDADTEPRDIKGQAEIPAPFPVTMTVAIVGALALGALLLWWYSRRKGMVPFLVRTPLQRVLDDLSSIEQENYPAREEYKQLYLAVSDVVRGFAQKQMGLPLQERTTAEMRQLMRQARIAPDTAKQLISLFHECDLVKFSQVTPTPESAADLFAESRALVTLLAGGQASAAPVTTTPEAQALG